LGGLKTLRLGEYAAWTSAREVVVLEKQSAEEEEQWSNLDIPLLDSEKYQWPSIYLFLPRVRCAQSEW
jgi:hypothetical protein